MRACWRFIKRTLRRTNSLTFMPVALLALCKNASSSPSNRTGSGLVFVVFIYSRNYNAIRRIARQKIFQNNSCVPLYIAIHRIAMKSKAPIKPVKESSALGNPKAIRFSESDEAMIAEMKKLTRLDASEVVRIAVQYAVPKFLSGEAKISDLQPAPAR